MVKTNYKILMDKEVEHIKDMGVKPKLLLHSCCAPCSSAVLEMLCYVFDITLFFYNPNISPEEEFKFRLDELKRLTKEMGLTGIKVISPDYDNNEFEIIAYGLENLPEGGARCYKCYNQRLEKTAQYAKDNKFDYFTTTLSISPYKNAVWLNELGTELSLKYGVKYLPSDFKKGNGYKRSCELSKEYELYRQDYCGCEYSKLQRNNGGNL